LVQAILLGVLIGGVYALMASGLTLVFGVMRIINVAQGAFLVLVAYLTWWTWSHTGADPILLSLVMAPLMFGVGWLLYQGVFRRIRGSTASMSVLLSFGLAILIEGLIGPLAPDPSGRERDIVQSLTLAALRSLGVADARARGLVVQTVMPTELAKSAQ